MALFAFFARVPLDCRETMVRLRAKCRSDILKLKFSVFEDSQTQVIKMFQFFTNSYEL